MESPVVSADEMRAAEAAAFSRGITADSLMEDAGAGIARTVSKFFPCAGHCVVFAGKGNNGGDALVAARRLREGGWKIELRMVFPTEELAELPRAKLAPLANSPAENSRHATPLIVLDGLLGIGSKLPLREPIRTACREVNQLHTEANAFVFALDLPSGLESDSGAADSDAVIADMTVAIGFAKRGLLADDALNYVGRLEVVPLKGVTPPPTPSATLAAAGSLRALLPRRSFGAYKNQFGRIGVVAGSEGLTGAAVLCTTGALRGGAGLVEMFVPRAIYPIVAAGAPPEAMVRPIGSYRELLEQNCDVWAIGPGLGRERATEVLALVRRMRAPMVIDADALNAVSTSVNVLRGAEGPRLITPHPGEMKRLFPDVSGTREVTARDFCARFPVTLLLKGSRTIVHENGRPLSYNGTGTPAMATGGMGDVLTGVCAALIGQKLSLYDAARVGAWVCGRAAEIALSSGIVSQESFLPTDLLAHLGRAFNDLREG